MEVFINDKTNFTSHYDCINLIELQDEAFYRTGVPIEYFGISFKILSLEYSIISYLQKTTNPRVQLAVLVALERPLNWDILFQRVKKEHLERKLGYLLELKNLIKKEINCTINPNIPATILDRLISKKKRTTKFHSKYFLINNRLERGDPYCILGRQWGIDNPLTRNEILHIFEGFQ